MYFLGCSPASPGKMIYRFQHTTRSKQRAERTCYGRPSVYRRRLSRNSVPTKRFVGKFLIIFTNYRLKKRFLIFCVFFRHNLVKKEEPKPEPEAEPLRRPENKGQGRGLLRSTIQARAARSPMPGRRPTTDMSAYDSLMEETFKNMKIWKFVNGILFLL